MRIESKIKVALYEGGKRIEDATLRLELWGGSGWRIWGDFRRQPDQKTTIEGRGSYGMEPGTFHGAILMGASTGLVVPTEKFLAERRINWGSGDMGGVRYEGYDRFFPTLDEALGYLKIGAVLCAVSPHNPGGDAEIVPVMIGKILDAQADFSTETPGYLPGWAEVAKPHTFKPVSARIEGEKFFVHAADGRDAWGFVTEDGYILSEINGVHPPELHPEIGRIETEARRLIKEVKSEA